MSEALTPEIMSPADDEEDGGAELNEHGRIPSTVAVQRSYPQPAIITDFLCDNCGAEFWLTRRYVDNVLEPETEPAECPGCGVEFTGVDDSDL